MEHVGRLGDRLTDRACVGGLSEVAFPTDGCTRSLLVLAYLYSRNKQLNGRLAISLYTGQTILSCSSPEDSDVACKELSSGIDMVSL